MILGVPLFQETSIWEGTKTNGPLKQLIISPYPWRHIVNMLGPFQVFEPPEPRDGTRNPAAGWVTCCLSLNHQVCCWFNITILTASMLVSGRNPLICFALNPSCSCSNKYFLISRFSKIHQDSPRLMKTQKCVLKNFLVPNGYGSHRSIFPPCSQKDAHLDYKA